MKRKAHPHEHEAEINLVPYLDIMVNLVMFMLVSMATATLAVVNTSLPETSDGSAADPSTPPPEEQKDKLTLNVTISYKGYFVAATGGLLAPEDKHENTDPNTAAPTLPCKTAVELNVVNKRRADVAAPLCLDPALLNNPEALAKALKAERTVNASDKFYDLEGLSLLMGKVKKAYKDETKYFLAADKSVQYDAIIQTMDATRGPVPCSVVGIPPRDPKKDECLLFPDVGLGLMAAP